jgi:hypothetical protein
MTCPGITDLRVSMSKLWVTIVRVDHVFRLVAVK